MVQISFDAARKGGSRGRQMVHDTPKPSVSSSPWNTRLWTIQRLFLKYENCAPQITAAGAAFATGRTNSRPFLR